MTKLDKDQLDKISGGTAKNETLAATTEEGQVHRVSLVNEEIADLATDGGDGPSLQTNEGSER